MSEPEQVRPLVDAGFFETAAVGHPVLRARHEAAWLLRLSLVDTGAALNRIGTASLAEHEELDALRQIVLDALSAGRTEAARALAQSLATLDQLDPRSQLELINDFSEAIGSAPLDAGARVELLRSLAPAARRTPPAPHEAAPSAALALSLVAEALFVAGDPDALALADEALASASGSPGLVAVFRFLINPIALVDPGRARAMAEAVDDPMERADSLAAILPLLPEGQRGEVAGELRRIVLERAPEAPPESRPGFLIRYAMALAPGDRPVDDALLARALEEAAQLDPQQQALQIAGCAAAAGSTDPASAVELLQKAVAAARLDHDPLRRSTTLAVLAAEMAGPAPREAASLLKEVAEAAGEFDSVWELAHLLDVALQAARSPYLDAAPLRPVVERLLERIAEGEPRIPGVVGLPEVAQMMEAVDEARAAELYERWLTTAELAADPDGATSAAVALARLGRPNAADALARARDLQLARIDCPALGDFCRRAAGFAPELALEVAARIPDRREQAEALGLACAGLIRRGSLPKAEPPPVIQSLESPVMRSQALMALVDELLGAVDRARPESLWDLSH